MSMTSTYVDAARTIQERWATTMEHVVSEAQVVLPAGFTKMDPKEMSEQMHKGIDRSFDKIGKTLQVQREFAHRVTDANSEYLTTLQGEAAQLRDRMSGRLLKVSDQVKHAGRSATDAMVGAVDRAEQGVRDVATAIAHQE